MVAQIALAENILIFNLKKVQSLYTVFQYYIFILHYICLLMKKKYILAWTSWRSNIHFVFWLLVIYNLCCEEKAAIMDEYCHLPNGYDSAKTY